MPEVLPVQQIEPTSQHRFKFWPWLLALQVVGVLLMFVPSIAHKVLALDSELAWWFNGWLGRSSTFDHFIGRLNSKAGDRIVVLCVGAFILIHIFRHPKRHSISKRAAFWAWTTLIFIFFFQGQRLLEDLFDRNSPGKELWGWRDINRMYSDLHAKVDNTHCFPSGHAMAYYLFAFMALGTYFERGVILLAVALTFPTTRLITGAHWPTDIFMGSVPLTLLASVLAYETPIRRSYFWFERVFSALFDVRFRTGRLHLLRRLKAAWHAFNDINEE